jgi:hypothetical protein
MAKRSRLATSAEAPNEPVEILGDVVPGRQLCRRLITGPQRRLAQ